MSHLVDQEMLELYDKAVRNTPDIEVPRDPILWLGLDVGIKRDTTALTAVFHDYENDVMGLWGHRIFVPPVNMVTQVEPMLMWFFENFRIGALLFDPYQAMTTKQKLEVEGWGDLLVEVNQNTEMVQAANNLHGLVYSERFYMYNDKAMRSHYSWAAAEQTERGWHVKKKKQTMPIDGVVSTMMAVLGASGETGHMQHPGYQPVKHGRKAENLV